jgi:hypothetical protein
MQTILYTKTDKKQMTSNKKRTKKDLRTSAMTILNFKQNGWKLADYCRYASINPSVASRVLLGVDKSPYAIKLKDQLVKASKAPRPDDYDKSITTTQQ